MNRTQPSTFHAIALVLALAGCRRPVPGRDAGAFHEDVPAGQSNPATPPLRLPERVPVAQPSGIELLHNLVDRSGPLVVYVSSTVENRTTPPGNLVDGNLETAWRSHTDDLAGAWIAVNVPTGAQVTGIRLTAGFTRTSDAGDPFTMNPRVRRVRVTRDGTLAGEFPLDPARRELQSLPVSGPAGIWRVELTEYEPGTRPRSRHATVSEFELWGFPPPGATTGRVVAQVLPLYGFTDVRATAGESVASLSRSPDHEENPAVSGPFASIADYCAEQLRNLAPGECLTAGFPEPCFCRPLRAYHPGVHALARHGGGFLASRILEVFTNRRANVNAALAFQTSRGWFVVSPLTQVTGSAGRGVVETIDLVAEDAGDLALAIRTRETNVYPVGDPGPSGQGTLISTYLNDLRCSLDGREVPRCHRRSWSLPERPGPYE